MIPSSESRSPLAVGMEWAAKISVIGTEFVVPMILGYLLDKMIGSSPLFMLSGSVLGFLVGTIHAIKLAMPEQARQGGTIATRRSGGDETLDSGE